MTLASGDQFCRSPGFWAYVESLKSISDADKVVLTSQMPDPVECELIDRGIKVVYVPDTKSILRDRHLAYWNHLVDHGNYYQYVLITDSKDVVFQLNPFDWVPLWQARYNGIRGNLDFLEDFIILTTEGFKNQQSGFALIEQFEFQHDLPPMFRKEARDRWVLNGGITMGTPRAMQNHHFLIWSVQLNSTGKCTDQAALNYLFNFLEEDETYCPTHPWNDHFCLTGEGVKEGFVSKPILKDGLWCSAYDDRPYFMIHQWDRVLDLKESVLAQYVI